jgi:hypothetical protein
MAAITIGLPAKTYPPDVLANRPAADAYSADWTYLATDVTGGTLYYSNGSSWVAMAAGAGLAFSAGNGIQISGGGTIALTNAINVTTSVTTPKLIGGTSAGSTLSILATSGNANSSAVITFLGGNNGAIELGRLDSSGFFGLGAVPTVRLHVVGNESPVAFIFAGSDATYGPEMRISALTVGGHEWRYGSAANGEGGGAYLGCLFWYDATAGSMRMILDVNGALGNCLVNAGGAPGDPVTIVGYWQIVDLSGNAYYIPLYQ